MEFTVPLSPFNYPCARFFVPSFLVSAEGDKVGGAVLDQKLLDHVIAITKALWESKVAIVLAAVKKAEERLQKAMGDLSTARRYVHK